MRRPEEGARQNRLAVPSASSDRRVFAYIISFHFIFIAAP